MAICAGCGQDYMRIRLVQGYCLKCIERESAASAKAEADSREAEQTAINITEKALEAELQRIVLTTETAHNLPVADRLDILTAECVIGMHLFKDIASAFRDTFGGRSKVMQDGLREAKKTALAELRREAHAIGADAVVGVALNYSEISGGGKSMLFLVASGTAVTLYRPNSSAQ